MKIEGTNNYKSYDDSYIMKKKDIPFSIILDRGGGAVGLSVRLASGRSGVRIPAATGLSRNNS